MKKEHPILFSTPMVQALIVGSKTQTRRIVNPQPDDNGLWNDDLHPRSLQSDLTGWNGTVSDTGESKEFKCRAGVIGDLLWVRETFVYRNKHDKYYFKADHSEPYSEPFAHNGWKPSIHMPKEASRIWLEVTNIRVERLQDISPGDACDEGIEYDNVDVDAFEGGELVADFTNYMWRDDETYEDYHFPTYASCISSFFSLWEKVNGKESLDANPWVWVIEFKVLSTTGKPVLNQTMETYGKG